MKYINSNSVDLVVTSPPYPMIQMWDSIFCKQNKKIKNFLDNNNGKKAFELMHHELDKVWLEAHRVLKDGGVACINIGDATRTINKNFSLYPNHARILNYCLNIGFDSLPFIIWRKQTNAPNKFMGSGMLPVGAYITLEHEYILILRKNGKRNFHNNELKQVRQESSFFWEERNLWFSDIWFDIKGAKQIISDKKIRNRSAAFPFELAYRLINMYSVKGDAVLDPFLGTGTTSMAAMASQRNSIGIEIDNSFKKIITEYFKKSTKLINEVIDKRIQKHQAFINLRNSQKKLIKYKNLKHDFPVITRSEANISLRKVEKIEAKNNEFIVRYKG